MKKFKTLAQLMLLTLVAMIWPATTNAANYQAENEDGVTICYDVHDGIAVVTHKGMGEKYSGVVRIPEEIEVDGTKIPVTAIGLQAFSLSNSLESVIMPSSIISIGDYAFSNCIAMKSIVIPSSVTSIGDGAFNGCPNLMKITSFITSPFPVGIATFYTHTATDLYVPQGTKSFYEATYGWNLYFNNIVEMQDAEGLLLTATDVTIKNGQPADFFIGIENEDVEIIGLQFDLKLPDGISPTNTEEGYGGQIMRDRCDSTYTGRISMTDGIITGVIYSEQNHPIIGNSGPFLRMVLKANDNIESNTMQGKLSNITLVKSDNSKILIDDVVFTIIIDETLMGDVDGDGLISINDITEVAKYIIHRPSENFRKAAADMDDDGVIDVADITLIVKAIMEQSPAEARKAMEAAETSATDVLKIYSMGNGYYAIDLTNDKAYIASQFDITLPASCTISDLQMTARCQGHSLSWERINDETCRIVMYSLNNDSYAGNDGALLTFHSDSPVDTLGLNNALFVDEVHAKATSVNMQIISGINTVKAETSKQIWHNLQGMPIKGQPMAKGIYLHQGKKIFVK